MKKAKSRIRIFANRGYEKGLTKEMRKWFVEQIEKRGELLTESITFVNTRSNLAGDVSVELVFDDDAPNDRVYSLFIDKIESVRISISGFESPTKQHQEDWSSLMYQVNGWK